MDNHVSVILNPVQQVAILDPICDYWGGTKYRLSIRMCSMFANVLCIIEVMHRDCRGQQVDLFRLSASLREDVNGGLQQRGRLRDHQNVISAAILNPRFIITQLSKTRCFVSTATDALRAPRWGYIMAANGGELAAHSPLPAYDTNVPQPRQLRPSLASWTRALSRIL